jgi:hypothetical protein
MSTYSYYSKFGSVYFPFSNQITICCIFYLESLCSYELDLKKLFRKELVHAFTFETTAAHEPWSQI